MGYNEFDIDSSLMAVATRTPVQLDGMNRINTTLSNPSKSTEEFCAAMVNDLSTADRNIMYTHSMLSGLADRLNIAGRVAYAINVSKDRGVEGFNGVQYCNPWEYAIEGKVGDFFHRVWEAIKTACRRILSAIVNFIKWIGNQIQSIGVKKQAQDYAYYKNNPKQFLKENLNKQINSVDWVDAGAFEKTLKKFNGVYTKMAKEAVQDMFFINKLSNAGPDNIVTMFQSIFAKSKVADTQAHNLQKQGTKMGNRIDDLVESVNGKVKELSRVFKADAGEGSASAHSLVYSAVAKNKDSKTVTLTVKELMKRSRDFSILSDNWLANNVKDVIASAHVSLKNFTEYTKSIDKLAKTFASDNKKAGVASVANQTSRLANSRVRFNSFAESLCLELESAALRFRKSAHNALRVYMGKPKTDKKKSTEAMNPDLSTEQLFDFSQDLDGIL